MIIALVVAASKWKTSHHGHGDRDVQLGHDGVGLAVLSHCRLHLFDATLIWREVEERQDPGQHSFEAQHFYFFHLYFQRWRWHTDAPLLSQILAALSKSLCLICLQEAMLQPQRNAGCKE